jgi:hypothetical protein
MALRKNLILRGWPEMNRVISVICDSVVVASYDGGSHGLDRNHSEEVST